jgi:hypothetical protein
VEPDPIALSHDAEKLWRAWCSLFKVEVKLGKANAKAAEELVKPARVWCSLLKIGLVEWLTLLKDYAFANDSRGYYRKRGVKHYDLPNELEGWQSAKEHELASLQPEKRYQHTDEEVMQMIAAAMPHTPQAQLHYLTADQRAAIYGGK